MASNTPKKPWPDLRIRLIQARNTHAMERQEQLCFVERCRVAPACFVPHNVVLGPVTPDLLDGVDALMIGGSGEYSAWEDYPWTEDLLALCRDACDRDLPTFGSCWGHQVIARALGGKVAYDGERAEFGCGFMTLTDAGREDPLFRSFPERFRANLGHKDRVIELPPTGVELAFNDSQPNQAFRIAGKPVYGTQFHSELDARRELERLEAYRNLYINELGGEEGYQRLMNSLGDTTDADHLMYDFLVTYVAQPD